jgi:integrase
MYSIREALDQPPSKGVPAGPTHVLCNASTSEVDLATVRKRTWGAGGETKTAWVADYRDQAGKRHIKTFETKKAATGWLVNAQGEVVRGVHTPDSSSITVAEAAALWIEACELDKLERSTLNQYDTHVRIHISPLIGDTKLARLTAPAVEAFRDELLRRGSRVLARKILASLKSILNLAQRRGLVAQNAALPVKVGSKDREKRDLRVGRDIPSKEEIRTILSRAEGRWRPFLITAVFTGMRGSELRGLTWDDVDFDATIINVKQRADFWGEIGPPKSKAGTRYIPMSPLVTNALREWRLFCPRLKGAESNGEARLWLVFPNGRGKD